MVHQIVHTYKGYRPDPTGGVAEAISMIVGGCDPRFDHSILVSRERGWGRKYHDEGVSVHAVLSLGTVSSMPIAPSYPFAVARAYRSADLMVHHAPFPLTDLGLALHQRSEPPLIVHWHADIVRSRLCLKGVGAVMRHTLDRAHRVVVAHDVIARNSPLLRDHLDKCVVVPYAVDAAAWTALTAEQREQTARLRTRHPRLIVSTGRLVPYKGYDVLLDAMADLDASLIIIGAGPMRGELLQRGRKLNLRDRLILAGHLDRSEMKIVLNAARVFVFPSVSAAELFGIAQLEAMTAALPVVNTALPTAVPHVARHGLEGLTVEPRNSVALARALRTLLDDLSLAAKLGRAGRQRVRECFDRPMFLERMGSLYQQAIASRRP